MTEYKTFTEWVDDNGNRFTMTTIDRDGPLNPVIDKVKFEINDYSIIIPWQKWWEMVKEMGIEEA